MSISNSFNALPTADDAGPFCPTSASTSSTLHTSNKARRRTSCQLTVVSSNVNGLRGKALQIQELICPHHPDIILHQETKLDASVSSSEIFPTDFTVIRKDRTCHGVPSTGQPAADVVLYGPVRFPAERLDYSGIGCPPTLCDAGA